MRIANALLFLLLLAVGLAGCDNNTASGIRDVIIDSTFTDLRKPLPSPSGRFTLVYAEKPSPRVLLKDARGAEWVAFPLSRLPSLPYCIEWSPDSSHFYFTAGPHVKIGLCVYSVKERRYRQVVRGSVINPQWSDDGRYLACQRQDGFLEKLLERLITHRGTAIVLDARQGLREIFKAGGLTDWLTFAPDGKRLAFEEVRQDEFGDFGIYALRVADLTTGRVRDLLSNRREPDWIWTGNDTLAVVTYDKYAVPTLALTRLDGKRTPLVTAREFARIRPLEYEAKHNRICYAVRKNAYGDAPEDFWQVQPGTPPSPLPANDPAVNYCRAKAEERIWARL